MPIGLIGGAISAGGSLLGGLLGSNAATSAANIQAKAANAATALQGQEFQQTTGNLLPYLQTGTTANQVLASNYFGIGGPGGTFNPNAPFLQPISSNVGAPPSPTDPSLQASFLASPGYQYNLAQSSDAIQNSAAGHTGAISGNMLTALQKNAAGLASNDWNSFYNNLVNNYQQRYGDIQGNRNQIIQMLGALGGQGQNAAVQQGGFGQNAAAQIGGNLIGAGNAQAAGVVGSSNALSGAFNSPGFTGGVNSALNFLFANQGGDYGGGGTPGYAGGGPGY